MTSVENRCIIGRNRRVTKEETIETDRRTVSGKAKKGLGLVLVMAALSLALSGCIASTRAPTHSDVSLGTVRVAQGVTAANLSGHEQTLDEYGVFYSTDRSTVVNVDVNSLNGSTTDTVDPVADITFGPDVLHATVITGRGIAPSQVGTMTINLKHLVPGKTYYYRFYSVGHDQTANTIRYRTLYGVDTFKVADPTLKSMTTNHGSVSPTFSRTRYSYTKVLGSATSSVKITVAPTVASSKVQMKIGSGSWSTVKSKTVAVSRHHSKTLYIRVTEWNHHIVATYTVVVSRK